MIAAVVLAAGKSSRMGRNKLLIPFADGRPIIVHVVDAALAAGLDPVVVVTGHEADKVRGVLADRAVCFAHNPRHAEGMAGSLKTGIAALPAATRAVMVCLGDMPGVSANHIRRISDAFADDDVAAICAPIRNGRRGHPVLLARRFFPEIAEMPEDIGLRHVLSAHGDRVREVPMDDDAVLTDLDTEEALADALVKRG